MNLSDRELLARTLQAEAGNQGLSGMLAAGSVVMNRANTSGYGNGVRGVILKPGQFSAWNSLTGYAGGEQGQDMGNMRASTDAYAVADRLLAGKYADPTGGATHYYNPAISQPKWGGGDRWKRIGDHVFGSADAGRGGQTPQITTSTKGPQMMQEQKPQGLLGSLGIQKMEEGAEGETGQRFYNRDSFKDTAAVLAQGFGRMGIMGMEEIADGIAKQRTENKAKNKTMEALSKMNTPQAQAAVEYISAGGDAVSALKMAFEKPATGEVKEVDGRLVRVMPDGSSQVVYQPTQQAGFLDKDQLSGLNSLRDDLRTELKPFEIVKSGYNNITTFYNNPSATSDYALAVAFAKILDPGSVAREGEVAAVQNAGARIPALGQALKNAVTGEGQLTQEVRQQIAELATKVYTERQGEAQKTIAGYGEIAKRAGLPADFLYSGSIPEAVAVIPAVVPGNAAGQGVTQAMWDEASMEEKKAWLE